MKVGSIVRVKSIPGHPLGIIVESDSSCAWPWVLIESGKLVLWPMEQMEAINESR